jgi:hypothetical protein
VQSSLMQTLFESQTSPCWQSASRRQRARHAPEMHCSSVLHCAFDEQGRSQRCSTKLQTRGAAQSDAVSQYATVQRPQMQDCRDAHAESSLHGAALASAFAQNPPTAPVGGPSV